MAIETPPLNGGKAVESAAELIRKVINDYCDTHKGETQRKLATKWKIGHATISAWMRGTRVPSDSLLRKLAKKLYKSSEDQDNFIKTVQAASKEEKAQRRGLSPDDQADETLSHLNILVLTYPPFSTSDSFATPGFLNRALDKFLAYTPLKPDNVTSRVGQILLHSQDDNAIGLGILASIPRLSTLRFITTPIRIGINGVVLRGLPQGQEEKIRQALTNKNAGFLRISNPIVSRDEVAHAFLKSRCGGAISLSESRITVIDDLGPEALADELLQTDDKDQRPKVVFVDEVSSIRVCSVVRKMSKGSLSAKLLFPVATEEAAMGAKAELPEFLLGLCFSRGFRSRDYFVEALKLTLRTEVHVLAKYYLLLREELVMLLRVNYEDLFEEPVSEELAGRWADYMLRLDESYLKYYQDELPWEPIVRRAIEERRQILAKA